MTLLAQYVFSKTNHALLVVLHVPACEKIDLSIQSQMVVGTTWCFFFQIMMIAWFVRSDCVVEYNFLICIGSFSMPKNNFHISSISNFLVMLFEAILMTIYWYPSFCAKHLQHNTSSCEFFLIFRDFWSFFY